MKLNGTFPIKFDAYQSVKQSPIYTHSNPHTHNPFIIFTTHTYSVLIRFRLNKSLEVIGIKTSSRNCVCYQCLRAVWKYVSHNFFKSHSLEYNEQKAICSDIYASLQEKKVYERVWIDIKFGSLYVPSSAKQK